MATKIEQLAEKARRAKAAKQGGNVDEFLRVARADKPAQSAEPVTPSLFSSFAGLAKPIDDQDPRPTEPGVHTRQEETVRPPDITAEPSIASAAGDPEVTRIAVIVGATLDTAISELTLAQPANIQTQTCAPVDLLHDDDDAEDEGLGAMPVPNTTHSRVPAPSDLKKTAAPTGESRYAQLARLSRERRAAAGPNPENAGERAQGQAPNTPRLKTIDPPWDCADIPAGSSYSLQQWADARASGRYTVFEVRNGAESVLLTLPKRPQGTTTRVVKDKKLATFVEKVTPPTEEECKGTLDPLFAMTWDGCLLLAPSAVTTHPGAISGELEFRTGDDALKSMTYRIVRPESHRETLPWLYGLKGYFESGAVGNPDPHVVDRPVADSNEASPEIDPEPEHSVERDRG